jgi:hypothetical protein
MTDGRPEQIDAWFDGELSAEETTELETWLLADPARLDGFVEAGVFHRELRNAIRTQLPQSFWDENSVPIPPPPIGRWFGISSHQLTGYLSSEWPVAYLVSAVIVGCGLMIAAMTHPSQPASFSNDATPIRNANSGDVGTRSTQAEETVATVTHAIECKCRDFEVHAMEPVPLGRKFVLESGFVEITYQTGAKVVLQGPAIFDVTSPAGGYLTFGRLTAKLESGSRSKVRGMENHGSESNGQRSSNPKSSAVMFAVRTPTAVVTDLGTEFGVEVRKDGSTKAHVFRGLVEVETKPTDRQAETEVVRLRADESAVIKRSPKGVKLSVQRHANETAFVRCDHLAKLAEKSPSAGFERWQEYSRKLRKDRDMVAYYTFESAGKTNAILPNVSAAGDVLDGKIGDVEWVYGRWPNKFALRFPGQGNNLVTLPEQQRFNFTTPFSIAVWFQSSPFKGEMIPSLVAKGGTTWRLQRYGHEGQCVTIDSTYLGDSTMTRPRIEVTDGRWHLAVAIIEPQKTSHRKRIYVDGQLDGEEAVTEPLKKNDRPILIGMNPDYPGREFEGRIDEVAILARAMSPEEIIAMFKAGNPTVSSKENTEP